MVKLVFKYNLRLTLTTNVEVFKEYKPCSLSVKPSINVYSKIKRQRFIKDDQPINQISTLNQRYMPAG